LFNKDRLRIGDLLAGTWVVSIPKRQLASDISAAMAPRAQWLSFTPEQLDAYGVYELQTLERVLREGPVGDDPARRPHHPAEDRPLGAGPRLRLPHRLLYGKPNAHGARPAVRPPQGRQVRPVTGGAIPHAPC
jgi:hypothetical protein